jgi:hypothetical protein
MRRAALPLVLALAAGCTTDTLYTFCANDLQCGVRSVDVGEDETVEIPVFCIELAAQRDAAGAELTPGGSFCTLECLADLDCESLVGLADGRCLNLDPADDPAAFYCYQRCATQADCYPSSRCATVRVPEGGGPAGPVSVCLPARL